MQKGSYLRYAACAAIGAAGILHLLLVHPFHGPLQSFGIFFLVSGIAQLFWIIPVARNWHKAWWYAGIGGTIVLIAIWVLSRATSLIAPRPFPVNEIGIIEESLQVAFIIALVYSQTKPPYLYPRHIMESSKSEPIALIQKIVPKNKKQKCSIRISFCICYRTFL